MTESEMFKTILELEKEKIFLVQNALVLQNKNNLLSNQNKKLLKRIMELTSVNSHLVKREYEKNENVGYGDEERE